jgi:tetratricopeptide (TPR) repeat protein
LGALLGFGVLLTLAVPGMVLSWHASPRPVLLYLMGFGFTAAVALFYVFARYRFPLVPILALWAAVALVAGFDAVRAGSRRLPPRVAAAALVGAALASLPLVPARGSRWAGYNNLGKGFAEDRSFALAEAFQRKAIDLQPSQAGPHYDLATALTALDRLEEAAFELETTLRLEPDDPAAHDDLGVLLARRGNLRDAERHFTEAHRIDPSRPSTLGNLGNVAMSQGRADEAVRWYEQALAAGVDNVRGRLHLIAALEQLGRRNEALTQAQEVLKVDPQNAAALAVVAAAPTDNR